MCGNSVHISVARKKISSNFLVDDGTIQFNELRNVIRECMKENGLKFQETEIDELTKMLFEDADTDGSGSINFDEFKSQLERHPAFMENLTLR